MKLPKKNKQVIVERHNKVVYDCGDVVVKVFNGAKPAADILNEALNLTRAGQAGINVPELIEVGKVGVNWAIATKKVEGKTLRQILTEDPSREDAVLDQLIGLELEVHSHTNPLLNRQKDKFTRMINSLGDTISEAQRYELLHLLDGMPNHAKVCHGDFVPSNIIIPEDDLENDPEGQTPVIVDWAHATQGNGAADCAITYLHLILNGEQEFAEKYLHRYCERQGCSVDYVQSWCSIVAAAELARGRVFEQDFLMTWVDVVDWV